MAFFRSMVSVAGCIIEKEKIAGLLNGSERAPHHSMTNDGSCAGCSRFFAFQNNTDAQ
jgi:hypothetical protein